MMHRGLSMMCCGTSGPRCGFGVLANDSDTEGDVFAHTLRVRVPAALGAAAPRRYGWLVWRTARWRRARKEAIWARVTGWSGE